MSKEDKRILVGLLMLLLSDIAKVVIGFGAFLLIIAITIVIVGKVWDPAQFSLHDVALYVTDIEVVVTVGIEVALAHAHIDLCADDVILATMFNDVSTHDGTVVQVV